MTSMDVDLADGQQITATLVPEHERLGTLPRVFGSQLVRAEAMVYGWMGTLCPAYTGGMWQFYRLSNEGFFMAQADEAERVPVIVTTNGYEGSMSQQAAGITACLFAFNQLAFQHGREHERFVELYHRLLDFVAFHEEAVEIFRAID